MAAIVRAIGLGRNRLPLGPNLFVVRERNRNPGPGHHVCKDGKCYHFHAVLHWPEYRKIRGIVNRLETIWPTPKGELQWDHFVVPNKQGTAMGREIGFKYVTEPGKDKIVDPDGPLFYKPPAFGSKEWALIEAMKIHPPAPPNWVQLPAKIHEINRIYGSFDQYWDFYHPKKISS